MNRAFTHNVMPRVLGIGFFVNFIVPSLKMTPRAKKIVLYRGNSPMKRFDILTLASFMLAALLSSCSDGASADDPVDTFDASVVFPAEGLNAYGEPNRGTFTAARDGRTYKFTTVGTLHVPSVDERDLLIYSMGGSVEYSVPRLYSSEDFGEDYTPGTDDCGFNSLPAGSWLLDGTLAIEYIGSIYWTSTSRGKGYHGAIYDSSLNSNRIAFAINHS